MVEVVQFWLKGNEWAWWATQSRRLSNLDAYLQMAPTPCKDAIEAVRAASKDPNHNVRFKAMKENNWLLERSNLAFAYRDPQTNV